MVRRKVHVVQVVPEVQVVQEQTHEHQQQVDDGQSGGKVTRLVVRCSFLALPPVVAFFLGLTGYQLGFCVWATLVWSGLEAAIVFRTGLSMGCNRLPFVPRLVGAPVLDGS
ncbi:unnamed protein product [Prorocentrum cordatum]|uniref:Transmembrane protein n=1 Tax=Prorocentrum cordatum TaxID=2364126 RepID=A0ABN9RZX3_9DINO|nr:unnamed protein product [Polarella glacialis]